MTVQVDIFALIIPVVVIILVAFLLPMIWQMKKAAQETDAFLGELRRELIPALRDVREITERVNRVSVKIESGSGRTESLLASLDETVASIHRINHFFRQDAWHLVENAAFLIMGIKAASKVLFKGTQQKGE